MIGRCPNHVLLELIDSVRTKLLRYEYRFFAPGRERVAESMRRHREILDRLARQDAPGTRAALRRHWMADLDELMTNDDDASLYGGWSPRA